MRSKVGVFDSGLGGVYTLKALQEAYPDIAFVFYADQAHMPYGIKTKPQLLTYGIEAMTFFKQQGCQVVVVACNTMSSVALSNLQALFDDMTIIGTILPTVSQLKKPNKVLVCATNVTVQSGAYKQAILSYFPHAQVDDCAASILVPMVENNAYVQKEIETLFKPFDQDYDVIVLGCTHFPVMKEIIQSYFPNSCLIDSTKPLVEALVPMLETLQRGVTTYFTSKQSVRFNQAVSNILNHDVSFKEPF